MKYDIIIIGSGLGGLVCAYILSKNGYKVLVVEKNPKLGGCMQSFKRDGVIFDTGMHYIGSVEEGQILHQLWNYLSLLKDIKLRKLDPNGFDIISLNHQEYRFAMTFESFVETLSEPFPQERSNLKIYADSIQKITASSPLYNLREIHQNVFLETEYIKTSVNDYIAQITPNIQLQNVLAGNLPLYAGVKDTSPIYVHALINNLYINNSYRIVGGGDTIANSLADSIRQLGGETLNHAEVTQMICSTKGITGIKLKDGTIIESKFFISNIHPNRTLELLDTPLIRRAYRERISSLDNTISNFTVYIAFKERAVPYMNANYYHYTSDTVWGCENYTQENWPKNYLYMHQAPLNDPDFAEGAILIAYMHYDEVKQWERSSVGKRGESYEDFKERKAQKLLSVLAQKYPGILSKIKGYSTSTPLTYRDYTATKEGALYGVLRDKNAPLQSLVSQKTRIPNLFLTGQNINAHGVLGVTIGAMITCAEFLGMNHIIQQIKRS